MNQNRKPVILFATSHPATIPEMVRIAEGFSGKAESVFLLLEDDLSSQVDFLEARGYRVLLLYSKPDRFNDGEPVDKSGKAGVVKNKTSAARLIASFFTSRIKRFQSLTRFYRDIRNSQPINHFRDVLKEIKIIEQHLCVLTPKIVVVYSDRTAVYRTIVTFACRMNIPILVVPSASNMSFPEGHALNKINRRSLQCDGVDAPFLNRILARFWPEIVYEYRGKKLLFDNAFRIVAEKLFGIYPGNPWIIGGGRLSYIAVSGKNDWQRFVKDGIEESRLVITGMAVHDTLFSLIKARKTVRARDGDALVVLTLPALPEHNMLSWNEYLPVLEKVILEIQKFPCKLMLSLHPAHAPQNYLELAKKLKLEISSRPLFELIPDADLFICSHSSTISWAILVGVPVLNLDIFGTEFDIYDSSNGVINITGIDEISPEMKKVLEDQDYYQELVNAQFKAASAIGLMDGHAGDRLVALVQDLMDGKKPYLPAKIKSLTN